jgi:hypothetical protein
METLAERQLQFQQLIIQLQLVVVETQHQDQVEIQVLIQFFQQSLLLEVVAEVLTEELITQAEPNQEIQEDLVVVWDQLILVDQEV